MAELEAEVPYFRSPPLEARLMCYDLPSAATEEELTGIFSAFGSLHSLDVVSQCAFVNFHSARAARRAVAELGSRNRAQDPAPQKTMPRAGVAQTARWPTE